MCQCFLILVQIWVVVFWVPLIFELFFFRTPYQIWRVPSVEDLAEMTLHQISKESAQPFSLYSSANFRYPRGPPHCTGFHFPRFSPHKPAGPYLSNFWTRQQLSRGKSNPIQTLHIANDLQGLGTCQVWRSSGKSTECSSPIKCSKGEVHLTRLSLCSCDTLIFYLPMYRYQNHSTTLGTCLIRAYQVSLECPW